MDMRDVTAITITDSNYRLLEYIKFSGTEYITANEKPTNNRYYYLNFALDSIVNDKFIFAANGDSTNDGTFRVTVRTNSSSYAQSRYGRNSSTNTNLATLSTNTFYQCRLRIFNGFTAYFAIANQSGTVLGSHTYSTALTFTPANMNNFTIMGYNGSNLTAGKVYRYFYRIGDASGKLGAHCYPAQRKSDSVCGLYDILSNTFIPMQGTNITDAAAGPTVSDDFPLGVSKIEDSNGDIIWGSQEAFPYRRLEYVHTNGTDNYLTTGCTTNTTKYREVTFSMDSAETPSGDIYILGSRNTSAAAAQQRYWLPRIDGNGIRFVIGSTWTSNNAYPVPTYIVANEKRTVFATTSTSSSNMKMDFGLKNASGSNMFTGNITGGAVSGFSSRELILMATNDGSGNSGVTPKGYCAGRLYIFIERNTNASGTITHRLIPCQRKSDGKVGMYDVTTSTFNEMQGTTDSTSLGPIVDEYWNLTA